MANEDYKSDKIVEIVREFDNTGNKYEVNGLELNKMIPFWRKDKGKFYALAKGQYTYQEESSNTYLVIQDETILGQATEFQLVYIYSQDSSKYIEDFPDLAILVDKYNQLVNDTTKLFTYLKNTGIKADTLKMTKVLVQLEPFTVLYMNDAGELEALPVSEMYSKFDSMVNKAYEEVKKLLLVDKENMSQELRNETDELLGELNTLKNNLASALKTLKEQLEKESKNNINTHVADVVKPAIDNYATGKIDRYVEENAIPNINSYIDSTSKKTIDNYINSTSKPSLDRYVETVSKEEINNHTNTKKTEITNHTNTEIKKVQDEGKKQLEALQGAGTGLAPRVDDLEKNKFDKGNVSVDYNTAEKMEGKIKEVADSLGSISLDWESIAGKPASFPPSSHNHSWDSITNKPSTFTPSTHTHPYLSTSGGTVSGDLTVTGTIVCNGDITAFSDKELKTNIKPLNSKYAIDKFMNIDFYSFNYKDNIDKLHYGVIAQELQKIYPEMVIETEKEINGKKALAVNYQELFIQVCSIVQEQERRIKELENKLKGDAK